MVRHKKDIEKIEELRKKEVEATLKGDYDALKKLFDVDAIIIPPGGPIQNGKPDIIKEYDNMKHAYRDVEVSEYEPKFEELEIIGDFAFEWGNLSGKSKMKTDNTIYASRYHLMRILRKQKDGSWRIYRSIWNGAAKSE